MLAIGVERRGGAAEERSFGAPLPGAPNVGLRVPANPCGSNTRVHAEITPPAYPCLTASPGSKTTRRTTLGTQDLYWFRPPLWCNTLLQFVVCGLPLGLMRNSTREEQPREGLFLVGAMNFWGVQSPLSPFVSWMRIRSDLSPTLWVDSSIYRRRPRASSQILRGKGANNWSF